jgi:hypothetical protein
MGYVAKTRDILAGGLLAAAPFERSNSIRSGTVNAPAHAPP